MEKGNRAVTNQYKNLIATEKRILTPSGNLQQVAAMVYRRKKSEPQILLITSRGTGRWILPKGWPQVGRTLWETAQREAYEEAGVRGKTNPDPVGHYVYSKADLPAHSINQFIVAVFAIEFQTQESSWPEREQRSCEWVSPQLAADRVDEIELKQILRRFENLPLSS